MRGKATRTLINNDIVRITPAYAGKSCLRPKVERNYRDHPRLCGEKALNGFSLTYLLGSPPPMRGKVGNFGLLTDHQRITPAYAGKS